MKAETSLCLTLALLASGLPVRADILELKNGNVLNGKYVGGTAGTVRFETSAGTQVVETAKITALTFTTPAAGTAVIGATCVMGPEGLNCVCHAGSAMTVRCECRSRR